MYFCMFESLDTSISHQILDYKSTFVNSQHKNTYSKDDLVLKYLFKSLELKISGIQKISKSVGTNASKCNVAW